MIGAKMKYVVFDGHKGEQIIIFPKVIQHSVMADDVIRSSFGGMRPISGGFVVNGQCVGESESLRMKSRGSKDTELIANLLDVEVVDADIVAEYKETRFDFETKVTVSKPVNKNKEKRQRRKASGK